MVMLYPHVAQMTNNHMQKAQVKQFKKDMKVLSEEVVVEKVAHAQTCNDAIFKNEEGLHDPFTEGYSRDAYEGCEEAPTDGENFAAIEIPKIDLEVPIFLGATENELSKGVGQVEGSSLPIGGNSTHTVLAGHRGMATMVVFRDLHKLQEGDTFYIHTLEGRLEYYVYNVEVILPHETENLRIVEGKDQASLITCHPYRQNTHRFVVHGERIK